MSCGSETAFNLFASSAGKIVAMESTGNAVPFTFSVDGNPTLFNTLKGIVTSVGYQAQSGFQFMHAMREFIYVYVFTERIGEIVVNGIVTPDYCGFEGAQGSQLGDCMITASTGLERLMQWYECNRITSRANTISIAFGNTISYSTFLVSMKADIVNAETGIAQFSMRFNFVPNITDSDDICFPFEEDCLAYPCA